MAKKQTTRKTTTKKAVAEKVEKDVLKDFIFNPKQTYQIMVISVEGLEKGTQKVVSGVVAEALVKQGKAKLVE